MLSFTSIIQKFSSKGEKTGWTYVDIPPDIITGLKLRSKKEFKTKGFIDDVPVSRLGCYPIGGGQFIVVLNAALRKKLGKKEGAMVSLRITIDKSEPLRSEELMACLQEDAEAKVQFDSLTPSHRNYFHKYILEAKTVDTKTKRVVNTIGAMHKKQDFGAMIRSHQAKNREAI